MREKSDKLQIQFLEEFQKKSLKSGIEALLFASGEPLTAKELSIYLEEELKIIENTIQEMIEEYDIQERGIKLISIKGSYQLVTKSENSTYIQKLLKKSKRQSLSQASLESLSIIAYQQPITRIDIDEIRGVKSESALQRLLERDLIKEVGRLEVPGRPILYGTTEEFLRQFGIKDLNQLPSLDFFEEDKSYDLERGF
ncbi:segregation/condensation protein B [Clostridium botulinum]|uniref:SMC-Scp complex subunit ScpB n=1 Tax=Clostridium sp. VAP23 TaxID=2949981 RepID=UPI0013F10A1D|nr:SMC-Scp complex subunit ScpB [Clostridium sp. VAP23]NFN94955.1 segregation/condensation protein B [Clostridium botulinum]NFS29043.1 segregation/condensation protein B [Clostridium botulinum]NFS95820.1 segregation/condensation protein B [Clostridium botulinum]NFT16437.1 segregation/condensation protein B [Clostridium botulinum]